MAWVLEVYSAKDSRKLLKPQDAKEQGYKSSYALGLPQMGHE